MRNPTANSKNCLACFERRGRKCSPEKNYRWRTAWEVAQMEISDSIIEGFLVRDGWKYEKIEPGLWVTHLKTADASFDIYLELSKEFLQLLLPLVEEVNPQCAPRLWKHLLHLNYSLNSVRIGLNRREEVFLILEIPTQDLDFLKFQKAINLLSVTANDNYPEVIELARNFNAPSRFESGAQPSAPIILEPAPAASGAPPPGSLEYETPVFELEGGPEGEESPFRGMFPQAPTSEEVEREDGQSIFKRLFGKNFPGI